MASILIRYLNHVGIGYQKTERLVLAAANGCRLPQLAGWVSRRLSKNIALLGVELFVALSLFAIFYCLIKPECIPKKDGNQFSGFLFSHLSHTNPEKAWDQVGPTWKSRVISQVLSAWFYDKITNKSLAFESVDFQQVFGLYNASWLILTFLIIIYFRRDALFIMLGVFCGLMFNFIEPTYCYPWDMPSLFFFTAAILLYEKQHTWLLILAVCLGGLFKETTLVCGFLIFFIEGWKVWRKAMAFVLTIGLRMVINKILIIHYGIHSQSLSMGNAQNGSGFFVTEFLLDNLKLLYTPSLNHVLFVNAGGIFLVSLIPWSCTRDLAYKVVFFAFIAGQFLYGVINEFRIWYEIMPLCWVLISEFMQNKTRCSTTSSAGLVLTTASPHVRKTSKHAKSIQQAPDNQVLLKAIIRGSHWLIISILSVAALVGLLYVKEIKSNKPQIANRNQLIIQQLTAAAQTGNLDAQNNLGLAYQQGNDYENAIIWFQRAALSGHSDAQNNLGTLLMATHRDNGRAIYWLNKAAALGNASAQFNLGYILMNGVGVPQDMNQALELFTKAARQGQKQSQIKLGKMYATGNGVKTDKLEAYKWFKTVNLEGDKSTESELIECASALTKDELALADSHVQNQLNIQQLTPMALGGNLDAQYSLGLAYHNVKDEINAIIWLQRAAERGQIGAQNDLGTLLAMTQHDGVGALNWLERSAAGGSCPAQKNLGNLYQNGIGVKTNKLEAYKWFKIAAHTGDQEAVNFLKALASTMTKKELDDAEIFLKSQQKQPN